MPASVTIFEHLQNGIITPGGGGVLPYITYTGIAAQRGRDFEAPDLERGINFRGVFRTGYNTSNERKLHFCKQSFVIDLVTVFDAILTSRQTREKLQCLYENLMSDNFRKTAVLKKISIVN